MQMVVVGHEGTSSRRGNVSFDLDIETNTCQARRSAFRPFLVAQRIHFSRRMTSSDASLLSRFAGWFAKAFFRPRWGARRTLGAFGPSGASWAPYVNTWTDSRYEQVRHFRHWTYVAIDRRATEVAMHSPNVSVVRDSVREPQTRSKWLALDYSGQSVLGRKSITPLMAHERLEPAASNHPLVRLLDDPNEPDTSYDLWYETEMFLGLTGNAYWWCPPNPHTKKPAAIWVLPAHWVQPHVSRDGAVDWYDLYPVEGNYLRARLPAEDVIHFKQKSPISKFDGYSTQTAASQWIDSAESATRCLWFGFKNGIFPGVTIEFDANAQLPDTHQLDRIEAKIMARYGSEQNANKPMFVPPGARVKKLQMTPDELGCFKSIEAMRDYVLSAFRVPGACVGLVKDMTYGSVQASRVELYNGAINPRFRYYGQVLTEKLARPRYDRRLLCWWEDRTPSDPDLREKALMTDLAYGARTMNEVRAVRGDEPFPHDWANEPWLPLNSRPVSAILAQPLAGPSSSSSSSSEPFSGGSDAPGSPGNNHQSQSSPANAPRLHDDNLHVNG